MKFYEIYDPYYALIKAKNKDDATKKYIEVVAGSEEEFEEIKAEMKEITKNSSKDKLSLSIDTETREPISPKEIETAINEKTTEVLLIDGSLI